MTDVRLSPEVAARLEEALGRSYSPYSGFAVAAAVVTGSGRVFAAPNIENASFGLTVCAERNAIFQAVAAGERDILRLYLLTPTQKIHTPCGACRQVMREFMQPEAEVLCLSREASQMFTVDMLLPAAFSR